jgi:protein subunit release factor A
MIDPSHLKIEIWPPRQAGGQVVGSGPSGIKITHLPSGCAAFCETERSQHYNRDIAMSMIEAAVTHPRYRGVI